MYRASLALVETLVFTLKQEALEGLEQLCHIYDLCLNRFTLDSALRINYRGIKMESGGNQEAISLAQVRDGSDEGQHGYNEGGEN